MTPGRDLGFRLRRLPSRELERRREEGARLAVVALDAPGQRVDELDGRQRARGNQLRQRGDREIVKLTGHASLPR